MAGRAGDHRLDRKTLLALARRGWALHPVRPGRKEPATAHGKDDATTDEDQLLAWLKERPDLNWATPSATVADIDDMAKADAILKLLPKDAPTQTTASGGLHVIMRNDPSITMPAKLPDGAGDWRAGGRGYVLIYQADVFLKHSPDDLPPVPPDLAKPTNGAIGQATGEPLTSRNELIALVGHLRSLGMSEETMVDVMNAMYDRGEITEADSTWPWSETDFVAIAKEAGKWKAGKVVGLPTVRVAKGDGPVRPEQSLAELMAEKIDPLRWVVTDLVPEGLGLLAAGPKIGKSLLALQASIAVAIGDPVLGRATSKRDVLIYSLEDGKRVTQSRAFGLLAGRPAPAGVTIRYEAPRLGGPLEAEIDEWLDEHPGGLVWIDMLAVVRPNPGKSNRNAYDEDYAALGGLKRVTLEHAGATVMLNTHDRKAGSDDWTQRVTGTRGVVGAVDFVLYFDLKRDSDEGILHVTGREVQPLALAVKRAYPMWVEQHGKLAVGATPERQAVLDWLRDHGPATVEGVASGMGRDRSTTQRIIGHLAALGSVHRMDVRDGKAYLYEATVQPPLAQLARTDERESSPVEEASDLDPMHSMHRMHTSNTSVHAVQDVSESIARERTRGKRPGRKVYR